MSAEESLHAERVVAMWQNAVQSAQEDVEEFEEEVITVREVHVDADTHCRPVNDRRAFPDFNDPQFPQEVLYKLPASNLRTSKMSLAEWFQNDVVIPEY